MTTTTTAKQYPEIPYATEIANLTADKAWTVDDVRRLLPDVYAIVDGVLVLCCICGRKCDFATVRVGHDPFGPNADFAWPTIAAAMNSGRALRF